MDFQIKDFPEMIVASHRFYVEHINDDIIAKESKIFAEALADIGFKDFSYNNFYSSCCVPFYTEVDYYAQTLYEVPAIQQDTKIIHFQTIPAGQVLAVETFGDYDHLKEIYENMFAYLDNHNLILNGFPRESYKQVNGKELTTVELPFRKK